jgi:hypothetical protein
MIVLISSFALILAGVILTLLPSSLNRVKYILGIILLAYLSIISVIAFINGDFISLEIGEGIFRNVLTITPNALIIQIVSAIAGVLILVASSNSNIKGRDISGTAVLTYGFMAGLKKSLKEYELFLMRLEKKYGYGMPTGKDARFALGGK